MGRAKDRWEELCSALMKQDEQALLDVYAPDALFLEPLNPPHEGNLLIQAYLKDWMSARENIDIATVRALESDDGRLCAVEWSLSYFAAGRRWKNLPRSTWLELNDDGLIAYQRDYY